MTDTTAQAQLAAAERAREQGDVEAALAGYRTAADQLVRTEDDGRTRAAALLSLGLLQRETDQLADAYQTFTEVVATGEFGWGEAQLEKARLLRDTRFDPSANRDVDRDDELLTAWRGARSAQARADQAEAHTELGSLLAERGEFEAARESFGKAVLLDHALWSKRAQHRMNELPQPDPEPEPATAQPATAQPAAGQPSTAPPAAAQPATARQTTEQRVTEEPATETHDQATHPADEITPAHPSTPAEDGLLGRIGRWFKGS